MCNPRTEKNTGKVIWITGLSASGKTTLARKLVSELELNSHKVVLLDGDELRTIISDHHSNNLYQRSDRLALALRYSRLCKMLSQQNMTVVIATISLFKEVHQWNRENLINYFEVYLKVPLEELKRRDPKGIYRRYEMGEIHYVAGLDIAIDEPSAPDYTVKFEHSSSINKTVNNILQVM